MMAEPDNALPIDHIASRLASDGYVVLPNFLAPDLCHALEHEGLGLATDPAAIDAGIGRGAHHATDHSIRITRIRWLDGATTAQAAFLAEAERLRLALNQALFLGLNSFEAQFALTPVGGYYKRHLDSFEGQRNRLISLVAYCDADWRPEDGGCLRIWPPADGDASIDIAPRRSTVVLMRAEDVAHEVLVSSKPRVSLAGWFRIRPVGSV